jgi:hypothetical protein
LQRVARQRSEYLRDEWFVRLTGWTFEQLMFVDESAANEFTVHRRFGWSPIGRPATTTCTLRRSRKWSILPLYTCEGFVDWMIIQGSFNGDLFIQFLEEHVMPHTNPFPEPRSVLVMDNAKIHHDQVYIPYQIY